MHISRVICCTHGSLKYVMKRGLQGGRGPPAIQGALLQLIIAFQLGLKRWENLHKSMHTTLFTSPKQAGGGTEETPPPPPSPTSLPQNYILIQNFPMGKPVLITRLLLHPYASLVSIPSKTKILDETMTS